MADKTSRYMNYPLSNEAWDQIEPNRFELLLLNPFLETMYELMAKKAVEKRGTDKRHEEKARRREEHECRVREAQERKRLKGAGQ